MKQQIFLTAAQVRERYGDVSRMWIYRRTADSWLSRPGSLRSLSLLAGKRP